MKSISLRGLCLTILFGYLFPTDVYGFDFIPQSHSPDFHLRKSRSPSQLTDVGQFLENYETEELIKYKVEKGDLISRIVDSRLPGLGHINVIKLIGNINPNIDDVDFLKVGQEILIPTREYAVLLLTGSRPIPYREVASVVSVVSKDEKKPLPPPPTLPNKPLGKSDDQEKKNQEKILIVPEFEHLYTTINGRNTENQKKLQLLSISHYRVSLYSQFDINKWTIKAGMSLGDVKFEKPLGTNLTQNEFSYNYIHFKAMYRLMPNWSFGLSQSFGDHYLHKALNSGVTFFKTNRYVAKVTTKIDLYKGDTLDLSVGGGYGKSIITADQGNSTEGGNNYNAFIKVETHKKNKLNYYMGLIYEIHHEKADTYEQKLINSGIGLGLKKNF
jgi:hypothetical protein